MKRTALFLSIAILATAFATAQEAEPKPVILPIALNLLPGYGIGSFVQGDPLGGLVCLGGESAGTLFLCMYFFTGLFTDQDTRAYGWIGMGLWGGSIVFSVVRPIAFARRYNREHGFSSLSIAPALASFDGEAPSPGFVVKLSY